MRKIILRFLKLLFIILITLSILMGAVPKLALAQTPAASPTSESAPVTTTGTWYNQSFPEFFTKVYDPNYSTPNEIFGERYTAAQVQWVIYSLFSFIITGGQTGNAEIIACAMSGDAASCMEGAINKLRDLIPKQYWETSSSQPRSFLATVTSNPISGVGYITELASKFHIIPEAQAQAGFGYSQNNFVRDLWRISRNISYALMVVAVIIMSFMIMFRVKISPQVVITIQSALPKIVFALILITFSYAIAGLLIDLMYVVIGLLATILTYDWGGGLRLSGFRWDQMFRVFTWDDIFFILIKYWLSFTWTATFNLVSAGIFYALIFSILAFLSIIVLIWNSVRIMVMMFRTFFNILIAIVTAPFSILTGTIVQGAGFGPWLRGLISNLMVYPVVALMLFFANYLLKMSASANLLSFLADGPAWLYWGNPYTPADLKGVWWDPPLSNGFAQPNGFSIRGILLMAASWTIIAMVPRAVEVIKALMAGKEIGEGGLGELLAAPRFAANVGASSLEVAAKESAAAKLYGRAQVQQILSGILHALSR